LRPAEHPFQFVTAAYLTKIGNQSASNLEELRYGLETCSDASVLYHTFQSLEPEEQPVTIPRVKWS
jgi:hypothetical protein